MNLKVTAHVNANQLIISMPQADLSEQLPNIIAINKDKRICAIGQEAEEMYQTDVAEGWSEKYQLRFINPFEFDKHGAGYAVSILGFYVHQAFQKMKWDLILSRLFCRCDYDLWLWNYESLPAEARDEFKYLLQKKSFWKIHKISVNGSIAQPSAEFLHKKKVEIRQRQIADFTFRLFNVFWMGLLFLALYWLIPKGIWTKSTPFDGYIVAVIAALIALLVATLIFGGPFIGTIFWMYVMRRYLPAQIIRDVLPPLGFLNKLLNSFADKILGEVVPNLDEPESKRNTESYRGP